MRSAEERSLPALLRAASASAVRILLRVMIILRSSMSVASQRMSLNATGWGCCCCLLLRARLSLCCDLES